ncbi:hypothetical protein HC928_22735, partial [bacterium]|nr:hypothetical protein [bacterium]
MRLRPWHLYLLLTIVLAGLWAVPVHSQTTYVYGIFFYSPTCPHCHEVIDNDWPLMQEEFGDHLRVLFIDASTAAGAAIMQQARDAMNIPSSGVPMLIMGEHVLVGSVEIPAEAPGIVRAALQAGGIGLPPIPGIEPVFQAALQRAGLSTEITETGKPPQRPHSTVPQPHAARPVAARPGRQCAGRCCVAGACSKPGDHRP